MAPTAYKIEECVAHYREKLRALPRPPQSLSKAPDSRLQVILKKVGAKRRSAHLLEQLEEAFNAAGVTTYPRLTDPDLGLEDRVYFLESADGIEGLAPQRALFRDERTLQEFMWSHRDWFPDLRKLGLHEFSEQAVLDSGRRIDILCKRKGSRQLVGIELKVREADDRAVGQLEQYLSDLADHARNHGFESTHLIVITGQPDQSVRERVERYAAAHHLEVTFLLYRVDMRLHAHP